MKFNIFDIRRQFPILGREVNGYPLCYLDNAATTFSPTVVLDKVREFETGYRANVARGVHRLASEATDAYESARASVAKYINAKDVNEVVFTSGTTGSINQLAFGLEGSINPGDEILVSTLEHHSNFVPWQMLCQRTGATLRLIPVSSEGILDLSAIGELVGERCRIIAVTQVSNVTGDISELRTISAAAKRVGAKLVVDGAQAVPHGPVDVQALDIDFYAFSGHKCYGPTGVGVLWGKSEWLEQLPEFMVGGGMVERVTVSGTTFLTSNQRLEAGTPPIAQAIGLGAAVEWLEQLPWGEIREHEARLMNQLFRDLNTISGLRTIGSDLNQPRLPIISFDIEGCHPHDICHIADQYGVALRGGHHCAQPLMDAVGVMATTRASMAVFTSQEDIETLVVALHKVVEVLR